jgi:hypothetical protein
VGVKIPRRRHGHVVWWGQTGARPSISLFFIDFVSRSATQLEVNLTLLVYDLSFENLYALAFGPHNHCIGLLPVRKTLL